MISKRHQNSTTPKPQNHQSNFNPASPTIPTFHLAPSKPSRPTPEQNPAEVGFFFEKFFRGTLVLFWCAFPDIGAYRGAFSPVSAPMRVHWCFLGAKVENAIRALKILF